MARDRFVYWPKHRLDDMPKVEAIQAVLEDYVRGLGTVEKRERFYVTLNGRPSSAKKSVFPIHAHVEDEEARWFEVFVQAEHVDIITRRADDITNAVADGFEQLCVHLWRGIRVE